MSAIHLTLTGKGGVGKSWITAAIANYLKMSEVPLFAADTDPSNPTFASIPYFEAKHVNIMTPAMNIDRSRFDELIEGLVAHQGNCVVDNGSSSFLPMMAYMLENDVINFLINQGKKVYVHAVLVGGEGLMETQRCVDTLIKANVPNLVIWENEFNGPVIKDGKRFVESDLYQENHKRFAGVIRIAERSQDTFGKDLKAMGVARLAFAEVIASPEFRMMSRQRLTTVWRDISQQLDKVEF
jgi:Mrp family chromosome partitioning ATPase